MENTQHKSCQLMARWGKRVFESRLPQIITRRKASCGCQAQGGEMGCQAMSKGTRNLTFDLCFSNEVINEQ